MGERPARVQPIELRSATDGVTHELRRSILAGDLAPGEAFSLRTIATELGVSFIPVREALRHLEAEGLVVTRPGRSAVVAPLDLADLRAIYSLRRTLEPALARRSCLLLTEAELDDIDLLAGPLGQVHRSMDEIYEEHRAFHWALLGPAASTWDRRVLTMLWQAGERYIRVGFGRLDHDPAEHHRRGDAHHALVTAFRTRDPERAAAEVERHLASNEQLALLALDADSAAEG